MDAYYVTPVGPFTDSVGATFTTFTTRQDVSPIPVPVIYGYQLRAGSKIKIEAEGEYSSTGTPTIILGFYIGQGIGTVGVPPITTVLAESGTISLATAAAWPWRLEWRGIVTTTGTSGAVVGQGDCEQGTSLTAFTSTAIPITQALRTVAWNTTVANAIGVCATFSASNAANTVKVNNLSVMLLN